MILTGAVCDGGTKIMYKIDFLIKFAFNNDEREWKLRVRVFLIQNTCKLDYYSIELEIGCLSFVFFRQFCSLHDRNYPTVVDSVQKLLSKLRTNFSVFFN